MNLEECLVKYRLLNSKDIKVREVRNITGLKKLTKDEIIQKIELIKNKRRVRFENANELKPNCVKKYYNEKHRFEEMRARCKMLDLSKQHEGTFWYRDYIIRISSDVERDWNYYSGSYKFPKIIVSNRKVEIMHFKKGIQIQVFNLKTFRGNFLKKILLEDTKIINSIDEYNAWRILEKILN